MTTKRIEKDEEPDYIPFSYLNALAYCPRRFYYEFTLGEMVVNEQVLGGQYLHERVDAPGYNTRENKKQFRHLYLHAPKLRLYGYCDLVELTESEIQANNLLALATLAIAGGLYPVEYKKGKLGKWLSDHVQLCAQAMALEEVLSIPPGSIGQGYIFYFGSSRRDEVPLDDGLRARTLAILEQAFSLAAQPVPPPPITNRHKCEDCSLEPICLPTQVRFLNTKNRNEVLDDDSLPD